MINIPEKLVEYLSKSNFPIIFVLPDLARKHSQVASILRKTIKEYTDVNPEDRDALFSLGRFIAQVIAKRKISLLLNEDIVTPVKPYDHVALRNFDIDENNLVDIVNFDVSVGGLRAGTSVFELLPPIFNAENSGYWIYNKLVSLRSKGEVRIRLDPFIIQNSTHYNRVEYKMWVYGKSLNWKDIQELKNPLHMRWTPDPGWQQDVVFTDLVWDPRQDGIHFICEEVPRLEEINTRGSRYFHGIYVPEENRFIHCDGAVRLFSPSEIKERLSSHVRKIGKIGKRIKIFQTDFKITTEDWTSLISAFFVWNYDIDKYFKSGK